MALSLAATAHAASELDKLARAGLKALRDDDPVQAEINLKRAVRLKPDNADLHAALALALSLGHERPQALAEYKTAMRMDRRYVEGRKITDMAQSRGWLKDPPGHWDGEQDDLQIEILNEPKPHQADAVKPTLTFPDGWMVDGPLARPDAVGSRATILFDGGRDLYGADDALDWFDKQRRANSSLYNWYTLLDKRELKRGGASGVQLLYTRHIPRYRESFEALVVILLKDGQFRRATYEAPESEFKQFFNAAYAALETLTFANPPAAPPPHDRRSPR